MLATRQVQFNARRVVESLTKTTIRMMPLPAPRKAALQRHPHPMQRQSSHKTPADNEFTITVTPVAAAAK